MTIPLIVVEIGFVPEALQDRGRSEDGELLINKLVRETHGGPGCEQRIDAIREELRQQVAGLGGAMVYEYAGVNTPQQRFYPWAAKDTK